ncbi:MAG TPA: hypothetical protein VGH73_18535 [Thermoanaerobaculia bacterium]|jgi:hypothetical protein
MDTRTDQRLREALEPRPEAVERIVRGALEPRRTARPSRLVPAAAGAAALAALVALWVLTPRPAGMTGKGREGRVSIENVGGVMIVRHRGGEEGGRWVIRNGERGTGSPPSGSVIVIHGGKR